MKARIYGSGASRTGERVGRGYEVEWESKASRL